MNIEEEEINEISIPENIEVEKGSNQPLNDTEKLENLALSLNNVMPTRSLPKQDYIQATVIPLLLEGISWIIKEKHEDPVEALAMFLIKNNPMSPELHKTIDLSEFE